MTSTPGRAWIARMKSLPGVLGSNGSRDRVDRVVDDRKRPDHLRDFQQHQRQPERDRKSAVTCRHDTARRFSLISQVIANRPTMPIADCNVSMVRLPRRRS